MSFTIDEETLMISGYKGDSANFIFNIKSDFDNYDVHFFIKRHVNDPEDKAVIHKEFQNPEDGVFNLELSPEDTSKLGLTGCCFKDYFWSLKLKNGENFTQTIVPCDYVSVPVFRVYP